MFKPFYSISKFLHVFIINIRQPFMDLYLFLGRSWEEYTAWLTYDLDRVMVMVVPDFSLGVVE